LAQSLPGMETSGGKKGGDGDNAGER